ncbi:hypothetical protein SBRCBS47491_006036 [Sporothrix bragantina]|uniref:Calcofluor white hypersensitive protein n=1 Tax=Sporothrix bragantina TaxID=671064 RepID=A0ABP0C217_9PEZI
MSRSRTPLYLGIAAAGGVGYYLYSAGGSPKVAEQKFENDLKSVRDRASGATNELRPEAEKYGAEAGAKIDSAVAKAQSEYNRAAAQARDASANVSKQVEDARSQVNKSIDAFDKKVEDTASKAKSGVSGWFGGK